MPYCKPCNIDYLSSHETCVLCHQILTLDDNGKSFFPGYQKKSIWATFVKGFILLNVLSIFITVFLDMTDGALGFSLIVTIINVYAINLVLFLTTPDFWALKISKIGFMTLLGLQVLTIVIGDIGWLFNYVIPIVLSINTLLFFTLVLFNRMRTTDDIYYCGVMSVIGLIPGVLIFTGFNRILIPSQISVIISFITLGYILVFHRESFIEIIKRKFHI